MYPESKCVKGWLHRFRIRREGEGWVEEVCRICKSRLITKIRNGRINNFKYGKSHMRMVLQPSHRLFKHEYGER